MPFNRLLLLVVFTVVGVVGQDVDGPNVTLTSDMAARLEIDGKDAGAIEPGHQLTLKLPAGEREIAAIPAGQIAWRKSILVSSALPTSLSIPLRSYLVGIEIRKKGYWTDVRTGLDWAGSDNGSSATVSQAHYYCNHLTTGGFHDWRLPGIDELQPLFGGEPDEHGFRLVVPLKLSGWAWSATQGNEPAENWALDFADGARASVAAGDAGLNRALCVRSASH